MARRTCVGRVVCHVCGRDVAGYQSRHDRAGLLRPFRHGQRIPYPNAPYREHCPGSERPAVAVVSQQACADGRLLTS